MGNIVSNAVVPSQVPPVTSGTPPTPLQAASPVVPPDLPDTSSPKPLNPNVIEGVGGTGGGSYNTDPFGPMPDTPANSDPSLPSIPTDQPAAPTTASDVTVPAPDNGEVRQSAADLLTKMPDINVMMKDLEKSGCLLPELQVKSTQHNVTDTSPLAALQPGHKQEVTFFSSPSDKDPLKVLPEVQLAASGKQKQQKQPVDLPLFVFVSMIALVQALQGLVQLIHFGMVKYPQFEQMIGAQLLTTTQLDEYVVRAALLALSTLLVFLTGLVLLLKRSKNNSILMYVVVAMIVITFFTQNVMARDVFASGNPIQLPETIAEILATRRGQ